MNNRHVVTDRVRISYEHIMEPYARNQGEEEKYSCTILLPKSDLATKARIDAAIEAAKQEGLAKTFQGFLPPVLPIPVYDGDGVRPTDGMPYGDECKGCWVFTASTKTRPEVVDINGNPIINKTEIYSGMYARVSFDFFAYNSNGRKGIGCSLCNLQKVADGEPLAAHTTAAEDFGVSPNAAAAPVTQQPYTPPVQLPYNSPIQQGYAAPAYTAPATQGYAPAAQQPTQVNPITGMPIFGINNGGN